MFAKYSYEGCFFFLLLLLLLLWMALHPSLIPTCMWVQMRCNKRETHWYKTTLMAHHLSVQLLPVCCPCIYLLLAWVVSVDNKVCLWHENFNRQTITKYCYSLERLQGVGCTVEPPSQVVDYWGSWLAGPASHQPEMTVSWVLKPRKQPQYPTTWE